MAEPKIKTHPVKLSPVWLHGHVSDHEITTHTARKLAAAAGCQLPRPGWYLRLPRSWPTWAELHHNPHNPKRPYRLIRRQR